MHMICKGQLLLRGELSFGLSTGSIHWQNKIISPLGFRSFIRNICDQNPGNTVAS